MSLGNEMNEAAFGDNYIYCWISKPYKNWRLYSYYIPLWIIFFSNLGMYYAVVRELTKMKKAASALRHQADQAIAFKSETKSFNGKTTDQKALQAEKLQRGIQVFVLRTFAYVAMFAINWFVPSINRVQGIIAPSNPIYVLYVLHSFSVPCGGFLNSIVYFSFSQDTRSKEEEDEDDEEEQDNASHEIEDVVLATPPSPPQHMMMSQHQMQQQQQISMISQPSMNFQANNSTLGSNASSSTYPPVFIAAIPQPNRANPLVRSNSSSSDNNGSQVSYNQAMQKANIMQQSYPTPQIVSASSIRS